MPPTINQMYKDTYAQRSKFIEGFITKQKHLNYPAYRNFVGRGKKATTTEIETEWLIHAYSAGAGSIQGYPAYGRIEHRRVTPQMIKLAIKSTTFVSHTNCIRDTLHEKLYNRKGSAGHIFRLKDADEEAAIKTFWEEMDRACLDVPSTPGGTEGLTSLNGSLYWGALSMDSSGNAIAKPVPARDGIYQRMGDGTITSLVAGADRALLPNAPIRPVVCTRNPGRIDGEDCERLGTCFALTNYRYIDGLKGRTGAPPTHTAYVNFQDGQDFRNLLNQMSGDRTDDYYNTGTVNRIDRRAIMDSQNLPRQDIRLIQVVNHNALQLWTDSECWGLDMPWEETPTVVTNDRYYNGQMRADDPGEAVACMHDIW